MLEGQLPRVQELAFGAQSVEVGAGHLLAHGLHVDLAVAAVELVSDERVAEVGEMSPYLVQASGARGGRDQGKPPVRLEPAEMSDGLLAVGAAHGTPHADPLAFL